jgi:hypothetical protein
LSPYSCFSFIICVPLGKSHLSLSAKLDNICAASSVELL